MEMREALSRGTFFAGILFDAKYYSLHQFVFPCKLEMEA